QVVRPAVGHSQFNRPGHRRRGHVEHQYPSIVGAEVGGLTVGRSDCENAGTSSVTCVRTFSVARSITLASLVSGPEGVTSAVPRPSSVIEVGVPPPRSPVMKSVAGY